MPTGLLFECDEYVASFLFAKYGQLAFKFDRALGLINSERQMIGAVLFHNWNGHNVEISYYGKGTLSLGIVRCLARYVIHTFNPSRVTAVAAKRNKPHIRAMQKIGFVLEGTQRCYYGRQDCTRSTGVRLVLFADGLHKLAKFETKNVEAAQKC